MKLDDTTSQLNGTTLRQLLADHPDWADIKIVCYTGDNRGYVAGLIYTDDERVDVPGQDAQPTGKKLLVVSVD